MTMVSPARRRFSLRAATAFAFATALLALPFGRADAQMLGYTPMQPPAYQQDPSYSRGSYAREAPQAADDDAQLPDRLRKQIVSFDRSEPAGTIVIDTGNTYLYYVLGNGRAIRYGVGVGREGFTWSGVQNISRKAEWPDWHPPAEMIARQPYLPRFVAGGPGNPLGARAMYLGSSEYRIHGTNDPTTIGKFVSSGCIRLTNEDVTDLFSRVNVGAKVVVLPKNAPLMAKGGDLLRKRPAATTLPSGRQALNISTSAVN
ncbi:L,D-transpeptidase [Bradyrhizobium iriomotense]|uniref:L,D-transpeptidase n=1 Tax=Bradyrhizobium iriomotense TaxID=441950 RepID=UPI001B8A4767|nr:L,D-transpeptidase [Bradyrhizobium iriomotense]MBR0785964.1 L,D-transpeptidase [Bradyrhizobium iriomotense]